MRAGYGGWRLHVRQSSATAADFIQHSWWPEQRGIESVTVVKDDFCSRFLKPYSFDYQFQQLSHASLASPWIYEEKQLWNAPQAQSGMAR